jgi:hypothetical protein
MSQLELVLSLVSDEKLDELIEHLSPETRQAIAAGRVKEHTPEIAAVVWHILEEHAQSREG